MISRKITQQMQNGSWIRKMFEEGSRLKSLHGVENVFDFSIGNPDLEPPESVLSSIESIAAARITGSHGYMSNAGYLETRSQIAARLSGDSGLKVEPEAICMTTGAAGAMNIALKALLDPGDEVIVFAPYFVEYLSYIDNHGGVPVVVECDRQSLMPVLASLKAAITDKTRAIIVNSPNNPSGRVYPASLLRGINDLLKGCSRPVYVLADEPYKELIYDELDFPAIMSCIDNVLVCYSWSKSLSLPGERIGYLAVSPRCHDYQDLINAAVYCNRILGYVNAPAFFQRVIAENLDARVDVDRYRSRRDLLVSILQKSGFKVSPPMGGFYLFPESPIEDDTRFTAKCAEYNVLLVPGSGFGYPGYARLCFAVGEEVIRRSENAFREIGRFYNLI